MTSRRTKLLGLGIFALLGLLVFAVLLIGRAPDIGANIAAWRDPNMAPVLEARLGIGNAEELSVSADGKTVVVATGAGLFSYRLDTLKPLWASPFDDVTAILGWSREGRLLVASSSQDRLTIRDGRTGEDLATMQDDHPEFDEYPRLNRFSLSPDGLTLAAGTYAGDVIWLWEANTGEPLARLPGAGVTSLAWSPDSKQLASGLDGGSLILWDVPARRELRRLDGHTSGVRLLAFSPDGAWLASASDDFTGIVWDARTGEQLYQFADAWIGALAWSPDSRLLAYDSSNFSAGVAVQDVLTGQEMLVLARRGTGVMDGTLQLTWSPDGRELIAATYHEPIVVWDAQTGEQLRSLGGHEGKVHDVAWSPDGTRLASASDGGTVIVWERGGRKLRTIVDPSGRAYSAAWSPDGRHLASGGAGRLTVWNARRSGFVRSFPAEAAQVEGEGPRIGPITWSQNGGLVAFREWGDGRTQGWVVRDGSHLLTFEGGSVTWSSDGTLQANQTSRRPEFVRIWDTRSGQPVVEKDGLVNGVWSPVGSRMASVSGDPGGDQLLVVWDARSGQIVCQASPGTGLGWNFNSTAWSPNGELLVTATVNDVVSIWDATRCRLVHQWLGHDDRISAVAWSPDGRLIATASWDGTVKLWGVGPASAGRSIPPSLIHGPTLTSIAGPTSTATAGTVPQVTSPSSATPTEEIPATPAAPTIERLSPGTQVTITEIRMYRSALRGWALGGASGGADHVLRTYDGGKTWRDVTPPQPVSPTHTLQARAFFHPSLSPIAWIVYQDDPSPDTNLTAWKTGDGGKSWLPVELPMPLPPSMRATAQGIVFGADDQSVWFFTTFRSQDGSVSIDLCLSRNGGQEWSCQASRQLSDFFLAESAELAAMEDGFAYLAGTQGCEDCPVLMVSYDSGFSWREEELPPEPRELSKRAICRASNLVWVPGRVAFRLICKEGEEAPQVSFLYTSFGGVEWDVIPDPYPEGSMAFVDSTTGYLVGRRILRTTDGGRSWAHVKTVAWDGQFSFANSSDGWAVARSGETIALVQTANGGRTWAEIRPVVASPPTSPSLTPTPPSSAENDLCSPSPSTSQPGWWVCRSETYGFEFQYPSDTDSPPGEVAFLPWLVGPPHIKEMKVSVSVGEEVCPPDYLIGQYSEESPISIGGHEWRRGSWSEGAAGTWYSTSVFLTHRQGTCVIFDFIIGVSGEATIDDQTEARTFREILATFRWLEDAN
jgi:WD40 repeat protein